MQKWEYLRVDDCSDDDLEKIGNNGWELVGIDGFKGDKTFYVFKRPKNGSNASGFQSTFTSAAKKEMPHIDDLDLDQLR